MLAYGHDDQVDAFERERADGAFVGGIDYVGRGDIILYGGYDGGIDIGAYHLIAHVGEVFGQIGPVDAKADYKVSHIFPGLVGIQVGIGEDQLMIMLSEGKRAAESVWVPTIPASSEIIPTRPSSIAVERRTLERSLNSGVTPSEEPTVKRAEAAS